jgi:FkbM family methyltransferase
MRNLAGVRESRDIPPWKLAAAYLELRRVGALRRRPPLIARIVGNRVAYASYPALVSLFEEIYLRRHYPFRPTEARPLVIDCGANIGIATMFFKAVAPDARVLAFEPEPTAFRLLEDNVMRNALTEVKCFRVALAAEDGRAILRAPEPAHGGATLRLAEVAGWPETEVATARLSTYITEPVEFLKLDVEGAEVEIVEELAEADVLKQIAAVAIEHHPNGAGDLPRLLARLAASGFDYRIATTNDRFWTDHQLLLIHAFRTMAPH